MSFTLRITNPPWFSKYWTANLREGSVYPNPYWMATNVTWECPYGAYGATDLEIIVVDSNYNVKHSKSGLGPVHDGREYEYNCSTGQLYEIITQPQFDNFVIKSFNTR